MKKGQEKERGKNYLGTVRVRCPRDFMPIVLGHIRADSNLKMSMRTYIFILFLLASSSVDKALSYSSQH